MQDLINTVLAEIDDTASLGKAAGADTLAAVLASLSNASEARGFAIAHRLAGRVDRALHWETIAESYVRESREFGAKS